MKDCYGFEVGCDGDMMEFIEQLEELDGFLFIELKDPQSGIAWFETQEQAQTAQWMLMLGGSEAVEGESEDGRADADRDHDQPGDWEDR